MRGLSDKRSRQDTNHPAICTPAHNKTTRNILSSFKNSSRHRSEAASFYRAIRKQPLEVKPHVQSSSRPRPVATRTQPRRNTSKRKHALDTDTIEVVRKAPAIIISDNSSDDRRPWGYRSGRYSFSEERDFDHKEQEPEQEEEETFLPRVSRIMTKEAKTHAGRWHPRATELTSPLEHASAVHYFVLIVIPVQSIRTPKSRIMLDFLLPFTPLSVILFHAIWIMRFQYALARNAAKRKLKRERNLADKKRTVRSKKRRHAKKERMKLWDE